MITGKKSYCVTQLLDTEIIYNFMRGPTGTGFVKICLQKIIFSFGNNILQPPLFNINTICEKEFNMLHLLK